MQFRAGVIDEHGRLLGHQESSANDLGYQALLTWMRGRGIAVGIESAGSFSATLTRTLTKAGGHVAEVDRLDMPSPVTLVDDETTSTGTFWNR